MTDTGSPDISWYLGASTEDVDVIRPPSDATELGRQSVEAMTIAQEGNARALHSAGLLRLHGEGVTNHSAPLDVVGKIALAWQKAVGAVGASLEGIRSPLGKLPSDITNRTRLVLNASPVLGSIVLNITPSTDPLIETEPNGDRSFLVAPRPLADRASERLISLLTRASQNSVTDLDELTAEVRELGPRVASAVAQLSREVDKGNVNIDASWREPETAIVTTSITVSAARFIAQFIEGQELDGAEQDLIGTLMTISSSEPWFIKLADELVHMDASSLSSEVPTRWRVGQMAQLKVYVTIREQPDGTTHKRFKILDVSDTSAR